MGIAAEMGPIFPNFYICAIELYFSVIERYGDSRRAALVVVTHLVKQMSKMTKDFME